LRRLIAAAVFALACASPGMPPGGPPDVAAPQIVAIIPDSGSIGVKPKEVLFRFDEVVAERPQSATTLADLFLISPRDGVPSVSWHRDAIAVKPAHGWRPNTPYTVIMMRGLADIRGNVRNTGVTTFFSTGTSIPRTRVTGQVFDWVSGAPAAGALIETFVPPDSLHPYVALVDSGGAFTLEHVPPARYTLRAYLDRNKNMSIDPSEPWDSTAVVLADSLRIELLLFVHDTAPPRLSSVAALDSQTLRLTFDKPVDPAQTLTAARFSVVGPDSVAVPIVAAGPEPADTSLKIVTPSPLRGGVNPRVDTTAKARPIMSRPIPISTVVVKLARPLTPKVVYRVRALGIRGLLGATGNSDRPFTAPTPPPPPKPTPVAAPSTTSQAVKK
jgi:hypothetical protein